MKKGSFLALVAALVLAAGVAFAAQSSGTSSTKSSTQTTTQADKAVVHHETGMVSSMTGTELVLEHKWRGKEEKTTFMLDSNTKKDGTIGQGKAVTVYFRHEKGERLATEIKLSENKPSTETKKS